ncbi:Doubled CXXCH motif [Crateriforma conspicua]|uniref:nitrite reductase (cytochrome; ammonia-forming) n=1 Tax=Crateriforma conspicua TaxID=2527996 RepID=A0A5C6FHX1_9PLAN|nr:ammonia-forming cytochrome c nitrite reductase subunit c552 [Crateriforma conspicua]TWU61680.1 Doubled CXXCH motif [Crateriforma conspicua]
MKLPALASPKIAVWMVMNMAIAGVATYALVAPSTTVARRIFLPGETTHGHYQIELACDQCHLTNGGNDESSTSNVMQDACLRCHETDLDTANDTHPASKFNDPVHADLLKILDAQSCLSCHREHVAERTLAMGLTVPSDYCWHCHQDVAESRPSHEGMRYDSCATTGCHNYHDNRALYEKYLDKHHGEADILDDATLILLTSQQTGDDQTQKTRTQVVPDINDADPQIVRQWSSSAHFSAGVNCKQCHQSEAGDANAIRDAKTPAGSSTAWNDHVALDTCRQCHARQSETFLQGKHGMRLAVGLPEMQVAMARLPMRSDAAHRQLNCNSCHAAHVDDIQHAAVDACLGCHNDDHSLSYLDSSHAELWRQELSGEIDAGLGVTCGTCHMPRVATGDNSFVNHNQNSVLRPVETMVREVCQRCHGLEFSFNAVADPELAKTCFDRAPEKTVTSVEMAHEWFEQRRNRQQRRKKSSSR